MIIKAILSDTSAIMDIYNKATIDLNKRKILQWDEVYPDPETIKKDIISKTLFCYLDDKIIKGVIVLNEFQDDEYKSIDWKYSSSQCLVIHRLCVDPRFQNQGIAKKLMNFAEQFAKNNHYKCIRLDSFVDNDKSNYFYENLNYHKAEIVSFRKGKFYCYEKKIQ